MTPSKLLLLAKAARARGFTLVEMMIAMSAGLLVAAAAFLLARNASSFFQNEARLSTSQFNTMVAMTRLQEDLRRASLMSSPNVQKDPRVCGLSSSWPVSMREIAGLRLTESGSADAISKDNGLSPDALVIGGLLGSTEQFSIQALVPGGGGGFDILLQWDGAMWRTQLAAQAGGTALDRIFVTGRFVRVLDDEGRASYGIITGLSETGPNPIVAVAATPSLATRASAGTCGCVNQCVGNLVNSIARVRWDLRKVDPAKYPQYQGMFPSATHGATTAHKGIKEPARTELVRVELDDQNAEIASTLEIVAELAVDLKFGITVATPGPAPDYLPTIARYAIGTKTVYTQAANVTAGARPERINAVQVRLSTRGARRDRDVGSASTPDGGLLRFQLGSSPKVDGFARVRTLLSDVHLPNQAGVEWP